MRLAKGHLDARFFTVSSWIFLPPSQRKLASCSAAVRIRYNYRFIPRIIPSAMTVKELLQERLRWRVKGLRIGRLWSRGSKGQVRRWSCPPDTGTEHPFLIQPCILKFWFISYVSWPLSRNNLLYKSKDVREIVDLPFSTRLTPISWKRQYFIKKHQGACFSCLESDRRLS